MDISKAIAEMKKEPGFTENVGMVLVHNGVVRGTSRADGATVTKIRITPDHDKIEAICKEISAKPGIFRVRAKALGGEFVPGDDVLYIIVAGRYREDVKPALAEALDRIKSEAMCKDETKSETIA